MKHAVYRQVEQKAEAESTTSTVVGTLQYAGARRGAGKFAHWLLSGLHWAPRRRNRARWHDSVTVRNTGAYRGAGGIAHRHRELHSVVFKRRLPEATREAAAGTGNDEVMHTIAISYLDGG